MPAREHRKHCHNFHEPRVWHDPDTGKYWARYGCACGAESRRGHHGHQLYPDALRESKLMEKVREEHGVPIELWIQK